MKHVLGLALLALPLAACAQHREHHRSAGDPAARGAMAGPRTGAAAVQRLALDFDGLPLDALPAGWRVAATNPGATEAIWAVSPRPGEGGGQALVLRDTRGARGQTYNLCWNDAVRFQDGTLRVALRAESGEEDQGGGLAWRMRDAANYYVCRWNPLEDNLRVYFVQDGRRSQLDSARVFADPAQWHALEVRHAGDTIACSFDGEELLRVSDPTFLAAGGVGLWTKADAATAFDDLVVEGR